MNRKLTIMFAPLDLVGVVNAFIGIAEVLLQSGHRIVFAVSDKWSGKLGVYGFEEAIIGHQESQTIEDPAIYWAEYLINSGLFGPISPIEKLKSLNSAEGLGDIISKLQESEPFLEEIVDRIKPDVIIVDNFSYMPSLMNCGIPWVWSTSCNPLYIDYAIEDERIPPMASGLPTNGDQKEWKKFREERDAATFETWNSFNEWVISKGCPSLEKGKFLKPSPYLNIYMFPKELDYTDIRQLPSNWHQFDNFMRSAKSQTFEIPEKLKNRSGKLIYLSLGSMGGADVQLMKKLVSILSKSEHRFIVSKGPLHDRYELADNMWGERTVPQLKILPIIDLYITHGGNNSLTECSFYGKPMIIMPLFYDQYDNAQRVQEKGFGIRLDPYECSETQLLQSIDKILNDKKLALKLENMSKRIQTEKSLLKINDLIEGLVK